MKRLTSLTLALASSLVLAGCDGMQTGVMGLGGHSGKLVLNAQITDGGYALAAMVAPYTKASVHHVILQLFTLEGSTETPATASNGAPILLDLTRAELDSPITISRLHPNTTYRVRAYAYKAAGTANADLISTNDSDSYVDVTVTNDDEPTMSTLRVKLIDRAFSGTATSSQVIVTDGGYTGVGAETFGLGSNGSLSTRVAGNPLAQGISGQTTVRLGNYVYQIGGGNVSGYSTAVQRATLAADGTLGAFETLGDITLATARDHAAFAVVGNYLYLFGGRSGSTHAVNTIERAAINSDGTISTFSALPATTSTARSGAGVFVSGMYVYLFGGTGTANTSLNTVERAAINPDGSLGSFATVAGQTMTTARTWFETVRVGNYLYAIAGYGSSNLSSMERVAVNADGTLGSFESVAQSTTVARNHPAAAVIGNHLYVLGGWGAATQNSIERAAINSDGSIGAFSTVSGLTLSGPRYAMEGLLAGNNYYVFGGDDGATAGLTTVDRFTIAN